jgi:hypothetical protein
MRMRFDANDYPLPSPTGFFKEEFLLVPEGIELERQVSSSDGTYGRVPH